MRYPDKVDSIIPHLQIIIPFILMTIKHSYDIVIPFFFYILRHYMYFHRYVVIARIPVE